MSWIKTKSTRIQELQDEVQRLKNDLQKVSQETGQGVQVQGSDTTGSSDQADSQTS